MFNLHSATEATHRPNPWLDMWHLKVEQQRGVVQFWTFIKDVPGSEIDRSSGWSWIVTGQNWIRLIKIRVDAQL